MFPQIKFRDCDPSLAKRLKEDLSEAEEAIFSYSPPDFNKGKLDRIRIRIFKFPRKETCNEFFILLGNKRYVCVNSSLLKEGYYTGLQHALHGIAHHFSHFRNEISDEVFSEFVSYSILKQLLRARKKNERVIIRSVMRHSPKDYNAYYRVGRRLDEKRKGFLLDLNRKVRSRKISQKKEEKIFRKLLKTKVKKYDYVVKEIPELEKNFRKI